MPCGILAHSGDNGSVRRVLSVLAVCLVVVIAFLVANDESADTPTPSDTATTLGLDPTTPPEPTASPDGGDDGSSAVATRFSDLTVVAPADLPPEALDVLDLIDDGGPYPYRQDDGVFQNREALLPDRPLGHYREYTVETPGSSDRGARRIVAGDDGERYYTDDHYDSFREVVDA